MSFPTTPLGQRVELNLGGTWTDITGFVNQGSGGTIDVARGHPDESTQTPASSSELTLSNLDFRFTSLNPVGPYYPNIRRNVPIRYSLPNQASALRIEDDTVSFSAAPGSGILPSGAVDVDIRMDLNLSGWAACTLASWWGGSGNRGWLLQLNGDGTLTFSWTADGTLATLHQVSSTLPVPLAAGCVRVTSTHAANAVTFYTGATGTISGSSWTQLGAAGGTGASTTIFASSAVLSAGYNSTADSDFTSPGLTGRVADLLVMLGIAGSVKAQAAFSSQSAGATTWTDAQGNAWTLGGSASIDNRFYRMHGEAAGWPQKWDPTSTNVTVDVSVSGQIRRLGQRNKPVSSAMYSAITQAASVAPQAYWPFEDGVNSTQIASGVAGGLPGQIFGIPKLAADTTFACSDALPQVESGQFPLPVVPYTDSGFEAVRFLLDLPASLSSSVPAGESILLCKIEYSGWTVASNGIAASSSPVYLIYQPNIQALNVVQVNSSNGAAFAITAISMPMGSPMMLSLEMSTSGGNVVPTVRYMTTDGVITSSAGSGFTSVTGSVSRVTAGQSDGYYVAPGVTVIGHVFIQAANEPLSDFAAALAAYAGETAGNRFARICADNGLRSRIWGNPDDSAPMGAQPSGAIMNVLQECADADRGMMYEPSECLGLGYRTLASLCNQPAGLTLAYGQVTPELGENEDDQITANDITVTNTDGSSYRRFLSAGVMSVAEPPAGAGTMDQQIQVNLAQDSQLSDRAGWELNLGTVNQPRYPSVKVDLATTDAGLQALYWQVLGLRIGDRIVITSPAGMLPPGSVDQLMQGTQEHFYDKILNFDFACVPSLPYLVGIFDDLAYGRADTDGSVLSSPIGAGDTSFQVTTNGPSGIVWTYNSMLFTVAGTYNPAPPFGITSVNGQAWAAGCGGGGSNTSTTKGGGGGGGEYAAEPALAVTPGVPMTVVVGAAGASSGTGTGGTGGDCTIAGNSVTVHAHAGTGGGGGGTAGAGGTGSTNTVHHDGGAGGTSASSGDGGGSGGGSGGTASVGNAGTNATSSAATPGALAVTGGGPGGNGGAHSLPGSAPASGPGGGGGGAGGNTGGASGAGDPAQALISWTNGDLPFNVMIGGEEMTVTAVQGQASPQTFTVTRAVNGISKSHLANEDVRLYPTPIFGWM